jgi:tetratricopeptide (TPR) repeat protein
VDLHEQRIAKFPDYPGDDNERAASYFEFAAFLARTERLDEGLTLHRQACDILEKWLQVRPSAGGYNNLAWQFATSPIGAFRDPARAVQLAKKAIGLAPREGYAWNTLGVAHYRSGDWKAAIVALEKSMQLGGGNSFDWFFAAMAHYQLGNSAEAQKWYRRAEDWMSKHQPQDDELRRFRAEARELLEIEEKNDQGR